MGCAGLGILTPWQGGSKYVLEMFIDTCMSIDLFRISYSYMPGGV